MNSHLLKMNYKIVCHVLLRIVFGQADSVACAIRKQNANVKLHESFRAVTWLTVHRAQQI